MVRACEKSVDFKTLLHYNTSENCRNLLLYDVIADGKVFGKYRVIFPSKFFQKIIIDILRRHGLDRVNEDLGIKRLVSLSKRVLRNVTRYGSFFLVFVKEVMIRQSKTGWFEWMTDTVKSFREMDDYTIPVDVDVMDAPFICCRTFEKKQQIHFYICSFLDGQISTQRIQNILLRKQYYGTFTVVIFLVAPSRFPCPLDLTDDAYERGIFSHILPCNAGELIFEYLFDPRIVFQGFCIASEPLMRAYRKIYPIILGANYFPDPVNLSEIIRSRRHAATSMLVS
jgi:hypothetical protein